MNAKYECHDPGSYAGDAATNALKLYFGGCVLKVNPAGAKSNTVDCPRTTVACTSQSVESGSFSFVSPAGASVDIVESPHERVTLAGDVRKVIAHK